MRISILHPFTPKAAGAVEKSVSTYHSQPHLKALEMLSNELGYQCSMEYMTPKLWRYGYEHNHIRYDFFPVNLTWNGDHKKWKKQVSSSCKRAYRKNTPDVTIINMSGHSSPFSYELSKIIVENGKKYIAMLGGQHYTDREWTRDYYKKADHILVHTEMQKKAMEKMDMFRDLDIRVFPLGVDCDVFKPSEDKEHDQAPQLLYVGRIVEWKRVHLALRAVKALKENGFENPVLNIIGPVISEAYYHKLKQMVLDLALEDNVHFLGHKEHYELVEYFRTADLFTLPSDKETFGMVMIEAMACGTPVAGIDCPGGPKDVITHLKDGILTSTDTYSSEIVSFFNDRERMRTVSENARKKATDDYSIQKTYEVLKNSVQSAIE